jgi:hypothetical protein
LVDTEDEDVLTKEKQEALMHKHYNLGIQLHKNGSWEEAIYHYKQVFEQPFLKNQSRLHDKESEDDSDEDDEEEELTKDPFAETAESKTLPSLPVRNIRPGQHFSIDDLRPQSTVDTLQYLSLKNIGDVLEVMFTMLCSKQVGSC